MYKVNKDGKREKYINIYDLYDKMRQRYETNKLLIDRDYLGDPSKLYWQNWELKYWVEFIERHFGLGEKVKE